MVTVTQLLSQSNLPTAECVFVDTVLRLRIVEIPHPHNSKDPNHCNYIYLHLYLPGYLGQQTAKG